MRFLKSTFKLFTTAVLLTALFNFASCSGGGGGGGSKDNTVYHTVTFNANDGTETPATSTQKVAEGKSTVLDTVSFTKEDYVFTGWALAPDGEVAFSDGATVAFSADTTLYAIWLSRESVYVITYNAAYDDYTGPKICQYVSKEDNTINLRSNPYSRNGYAFNYWVNSAGTTYLVNQEVTVKKDFNLYATWTKIETSGTVSGVKVVLHKNDGTKETVTKNGLSYLTGTTSYTDTYTRPGYTFRGWGESADSLVPINSTVFTKSGTYDYYAIWQDNSKYKVIYTSDMLSSWGSLSSVDVTLVSSSDGYYEEFDVTDGKATATFIDCSMTKEGYKFSCWTSGVNELYAGMYKEISGDIVVYPQWVSDDKACKITMHLNDGTDAADIIRYVKNNDYVYVLLIDYKPAAVVRDGYSFYRWNTKADESGGSYGDDLFDKFTSDIEVYAIWRKNPVVYFYPNYEGATQEVYSQNFIWDKSQKLLPNTFTREGYEFTGWAKSASATSIQYKDEASFYSSSTTETDINLYAVWKAPLTITFNANDGSENPATATQIIPATTSTKLNPNTFTREGYVFAGWAKDATATDVLYEDQALASFPSDTTLYAVWKDNVTVTFRANFTGADPATAEQVMIYNQKTALDECPWTREGYTFYGWSTYSKDSSYNYKDMQEVQFKSDTVLYAIWKKNITLTFKANDGSETPATFTEEVGYYTEYVYPDCPWTRDGYTFAGWAYYADDSPSVCRTSGTFTSDTTLYAIWTKDHPVLTLHSNDGNDTTVTQTFDYGVAANIQECTFTAPIGKYFGGWSKSSDSTYKSYTDGGEITLTEDKDLYAVWSNMSSITYHANYSGSAETKIQYYRGSPVTLELNTFVREGYIFAGWAIYSDDTDVSDVRYLDGETVKYPSSNFYAIWVEDKGKCTVTFNVNIEGRTESFTETYPAGIKQLLPECPWKQEGYCFMAWDSSPSFTCSSQKQNQSTTFDEDTVMYASWRKAPLVTFHKNDGTDETKTQYLVYGTSTKLMKNEFTVEGKIFKGWDTSATSTSAYYDDEESVSWSYDHDLYAIWAGVYKVTLNANDGTETPEEIVVDGFIEGESKSLPANTFTREGYTFYGWGTTPTSVEPVVKNGKSYKATEDVTLYAIWRED
jgi:uncharacterized repeat protein (TIGR02543 family)